METILAVIVFFAIVAGVYCYFRKVDSTIPTPPSTGAAPVPAPTPAPGGGL